MTDREVRQAVAKVCTKGVTGLTEVSDWWVYHRDEVTSKSRWDYVAQRITGGWPTEHVEIEGFWATVKGGIGGTYHSVSTKHLQTYLDEYAFRYNNRDVGRRGMFQAFVDRTEKASE